MLAVYMLTFHPKQINRINKNHKAGITQCFSIDITNKMTANSQMTYVNMD